MKRLIISLLFCSLTAFSTMAGERTLSLQGSEIDGGFTVRAGTFFADQHALDLFDYFMTLNGEVPFSEIEARVLGEIDSRLDERNAKAARAFWQQYLGYLDDIDTVERMASSDEATYVWDMAQQLNDLWQLRRQHFGEEVANRLFAADESMDALKLARLEAKSQAKSQKRIDPFWRAEIQALEEQQPEYAKQAFDRATLPARIRAFTTALQAQGLSETEIQAQRAEAFGDDVNARLSKLEQRRAAWQSRIDSLVNEIDTQANKRQLDPAQRDALAASLVAERFQTEAEQLRANAILRMRTQ